MLLSLCPPRVYIVLCCSRDAADLVVQGKGKFEELMVCSHEIAASTAQLVAASKVSKEYILTLDAYTCLFYILLWTDGLNCLVFAELIKWEEYRCRQRSYVVSHHVAVAGKSRQRQHQPAPSAAGVPGRHTGHRGCRGLHQVWKVPNWRQRWEKKLQCLV